ncbi:class II aldolase and Adducin N-terminal domain-containing protein [Echria macrotheca]|uniref:Class II aldolase and Adducin N-terminal domain-containing protein n=1 Tax=Echria macrotheca TaxID=438768 RepID=A0AAJ0BJN2_9PEZI|nr:class II aldolase and Adducin N-terminal domain-containing protein [Echria macrotheca]
MDEKTAALVLQIHQRNLIDGNHILHHKGLLDAYGHLSIRHPLEPDAFIMSRNMGPATVSSTSDLVSLAIPDAEAFDPSSPEGYAERRIHSEIYKRHPTVQAVVHSHSDAVDPFTIGAVPLRACIHTAGFLGTQPVPVYDAMDHSQEVGEEGGRGRNPLLDSEYLAYELAKYFDGENSVALVRGHGFVVAAEHLELAVQQAIYTRKNAQVQAAALALSAAATPGESAMGRLRFLTEFEASEAANATRWSAHRPWRLWIREVESSGLYVNFA